MSAQESRAESVSTAAKSPGPGLASGEDAMHSRILEMLIRRYDRRIMNNVQRGNYVECMTATALGADWRLAEIVKTDVWTDRKSRCCRGPSNMSGVVLR